MDDPEVRGKISDRTKQGMARAKARHEHQTAVLLDSWAAAEPAARRAFLARVMAPAIAEHSA